MGAAAFGKDVRGDVMLNSLLASRAASAVLAVSVLCYIASCMPPLVYSMRAYVDFIIVGPRARFRWSRFLTETVLILLLPLLLALPDSGVSEKAYAVTGATGVCIVCYVVPVVVHLRLKHMGVPAAGGAEVPLLDEDQMLLDGSDGAQSAGKVLRLGYVANVLDSVLPCVVLMVGCWLSTLALLAMKW